MVVDSTVVYYNTSGSLPYMLLFTQAYLSKCQEEGWYLQTLNTLA